jgi:hypothetical protein
MKKLMMVFLALTVAAALGAAQDQPPPPADQQDDVTAALQEIAASQLGTLTVADLTKAAGRLSVALQARAYVTRVSMASLFFPGAGQLMTGDTLGGVLFVTGDLAVMVGAMVGTYFALPSDLQFGSINYYADKFSSIKTAWENHSFQDYLPAFGVMAGGMILKGILGHVSSRLAAQAARRNIADGKITFTPRLGFDGRGFMMGFGMQM